MFSLWRRWMPEELVSIVFAGAATQIMLPSRIEVRCSDAAMPNVLEDGNGECKRCQLISRSLGLEDASERVPNFRHLTHGPPHLTHRALHLAPRTSHPESHT
ncbi:hypothetical protein K469DRAFT_710926 [Zopfia rhizophila CBS 207.26]|uniref:Uncharacterized protein n=1 Tax=Zopfia rhizophila CBS 207.26 TaxID=1314779 RepID=A0A6A6DUR9_9PEZI|nr:hypothetical protein K469DRAFT_710926 [Zopfia rhizophila CBS 207.26]